MAWLSIREFARRDGCDDKLVRRAIEQKKLIPNEDGRLDEALVGTGWRKTNRHGGADSADKTADTSQKVSAPAAKLVGTGERQSAVKPLPEVPPSGIDFKSAQEFVEKILSGQFLDHGDAEAIKENGLALKHILAGMQASGELVSFETAQAVFFETFRSHRDVWLNFPTKVGPLIAAELGIEPDRLIEALTKHVHQQCADLGEPDADFSGPGGTA